MWRKKRTVYLYVGQTREKFERCIAMCKEAALTMKTASGIKCFQDEKSLGKWFNILLPLLQSRVSCQPEQGVDQAHVQRENLVLSWTLLMILRVMKVRQQVMNLTASVNSENSENQNPAKSPLFVPVRRKRQRQSIGYDEAIHSLVDKVTAALEKIQQQIL